MAITNPSDCQSVSRGCTQAAPSPSLAGKGAQDCDTPVWADAETPFVAKPHKLFYGDNLEVLPSIQSGSVDLVYLDPPFNSQQDYNLLFREYDGTKAAAQRLVFTDTWSWRPETAIAFRRVADAGGPLAKCMVALRAFVGETDLMAYLVMMAPRLSELHRVLKPTGSLFLHCDPTASHYLKVLLDAIFGSENHRNEIVWLRSKNPKGSQHGLQRFSPFTDTLFYYVKSDAAKLHLDRIRTPLSAEAIEKKYPYADAHGPYADGPILRSASMGARPNLVYEYKGFTPGPAGWRVERERLEEIDRKGDLNWTGTGVRRKLRPTDIEKGQPIGSFWGDIPPINSQAQERLGYPTQKPEALLERIIKASTEEGDTVLDPFCGCGTTVAVAHKHNRKWIGIDVTARAIDIVEERLEVIDANAKDTYELHGKPRTLQDARRRA